VTISETEYLSAAMEAGANEYIPKPCTLDDLREKLDLLGLLKA
jgi:YesN/AraC family two-component response regulator